jgi:hypothetical protein
MQKTGSQQNITGVAGLSIRDMGRYFGNADEQPAVPGDLSWQLIVSSLAQRMAKANNFFPPHWWGRVRVGGE